MLRVELSTCGTCEYEVNVPIYAGACIHVVGFCVESVLKMIGHYKSIHDKWFGLEFQRKWKL